MEDQDVLDQNDTREVDVTGPTLLSPSRSRYPTRAPKGGQETGVRTDEKAEGTPTRPTTLWCRTIPLQSHRGLKGPCIRSPVETLEAGEGGRFRWRDEDKTLEGVQG